MVALSIDRYIIVKKTLSNAKKRRTITYTIITCLFIFCLLLTLPNWFFFQSKQIQINNTTKFTTAQHTDFGRKAQSIFNSYVYIPFVLGFPLIILLVINSLLIYELIEIGERKRKLNINNSNIDRNITILLVAIMLSFIICQVPLCIAQLLITKSLDLMYNKQFFIYKALTDLLTCINMSSNFVLMCCFGQKFRKTLMFIFFKQSKTNNRDNLINKHIGNMSTIMNANNNNNNNKEHVSLMKISYKANRNSSFKNSCTQNNLELEDLNKIEKL